MASNSRDERIKYVFDTEGGDKIDAIAKSIGDVVDKSLGSETAFGFVKQHLEELTAAALALSVAAKTIEFGKESVKSVADVEASLSRVKALAAGSAEQFALMDDAINAASKAVSVDGNVAASALANLASSGLNVQDAMKALVPTLQLAKIANVDVGTAANDVAVALKAFNLPASEAQHIVDMLTAASHGAAGGLSEISNATQKLAPDAKAIGLDFDQLTGILGYLTEHGIAGRKALGGMQTVFQELQNPTSKLREELLSLGDGSSDFNKAVQVLNSNTPQAREALNGLSGSARTVIESLGSGGGALDAFTARLAQSGGEAQRVTGILDDNINGAWNKFKLAFDDVGSSLAKPVLKPFADELAKLAGDLRAFAESKDFKDIEAEVATMAKNAAKALDDFLTHVDWKSFLEGGKDAIGKVSTAFNNLATTAGAAATAIGKVMDGLGVAYHGAAVAIDGAVNVAAKGIDGLSAAATGGASNLTAFHDVLTDVAESAGEQFSKNIAATGASFKSLAGSTEDAAKSTDKLAQSSRDAVHPAEAHAAAAKDQASAADDSAKASENLGSALKPLPSLHAQTADAARSASAGIQSFADQISHAYDSAQKMAAGSDALRTAFSALRITSQSDLEQTALAATTAFATIDKSLDQSVASMADRQNAFLAMAKAQLAAVANLDEGARASTQYQLESKAAALGLLDALEKLEGAGQAAGDAVAGGANRGAAALRGEASAASDLTSQTHGLSAAFGDAAAQCDHFNSIGEQGFADLAQGIAAARQGFLNLSDSAAKFYDSVLKGSFEMGHSDDGSGFDRVARAMQDALNRTNKEIAANRDQLNGMIADMNNLGTQSGSAFGNVSQNAAGAAAEAQNLADQIKNGTFQLGLLGKADLSKLEAAADAAAQRMRALADAEKQAKDSFDAMAQSAQDALDQETGNQAALEDRRHEKVLKDLYAAAEKAGQLNSQEYSDSVNAENKLHDLKLKNIKAEQDARAGKANSSSGNALSGDSSGGGGGLAGAFIGRNAPAQHVPISVNYKGRTINLIAPDGETADGLESLLAEIARQRANSIHK